MKPIKRTDWVRCKTDPRWIGIVLRVARDGSWADVNWHTHSKRMQVSALEVLHTIPLGDGVTLTDCTRQEELEDLRRRAR